MRLVKISAPEGKGPKVIDLAHAVDIKRASLHQVELYDSEDKAKQTKDIVDIETSTPKARNFIDKLLEADFYDPEEFALSTRQPASIISDGSIKKLTKPLLIPATDILEEAWEFSYISFSFIGRVFISGCLIAFGLINHQILVLIAGLLFLPLLPLLMAVGFGGVTKQYRLALQGFKAFACATGLLILAGIFVALFSNPPLKYDEFSSPLTSFLISLAVGIAAVLANVDETGKRELIGLAATAQIAIIPAWFGACLILGFPATAGSNEITMRGLTFFLNVLTIIAASLAVYAALGMMKNSLRKVDG